MKNNSEIITRAIEAGRTVLSDHEAKEFLKTYGIPVTREIETHDQKAFLEALEKMRFPLVLKGCTPELYHKSEHRLVRLDIRNIEEAQAHFNEIMSALNGKEKSLLVQEMINGSRELMVGMTRDSQFGPCVMFGLGGIFTEILSDVCFRVAPIKKEDAQEMFQEIKSYKILDEVRGMPAADLDRLSDIIIKIGEIGLSDPGKIQKGLLCSP